MRQFLILLIISLNLFANSITPNEVYSQVEKITHEVHFLLENYGIDHNHKNSMDKIDVQAEVRPRNVWQKTYEIMIKINILRTSYGLPIIEPVNIAPVLDLNPDLVYEQTQRILTELEIFKFRLGLNNKKFKIKSYKNKNSQDVYKLLSEISLSLDKLNNTEFTPSYVFGENIRVNDDLSIILHHLNIKDNTIPSIRNEKATPSDTFTVAMKTLNKIAILQKSVGIQSVDFSAFRKEKINPSDVFSMVEMIIAEIQTIKAFIGVHSYITPAATRYFYKTPADVDQLMNWNLRKIELIKKLSNKRERL